MLIKEVYDKATLKLEQANIENARLNAEVLICNIYNWDRSKFYLNLFEEMQQGEIAQLDELITRRIKHEPLQYITGIQNFYGRDFKVNSDVLIPRPETELLIEELIKEVNSLSKGTEITAVDIGTGSGAIAITLALENKNWKVYAVDISAEALQVAEKNAENLKANVVFLQGDLLTSLIDKDIYVDIIVSNPPYIPNKDIPQLMPEVRNYEPLIALNGGIDGLDFYRKLLIDSKKILKKSGIIVFEIGIGQDKEITILFEKHGAKKTKIIDDYQGIARVIIGWF